MTQSDRNSADLSISTGSLLLFAPPVRAEAMRYAASAIFVLTMAFVVASLLRVSFRMPDKVSETDSVVMVDLPPAARRSAPLRDAAGGPEQAASDATPESVAPPMEPQRPTVAETLPALETPTTPPPPEAPAPDAVLSPKKDTAPPPRPVAAAPAPQVEAQAPQGAAQPKDSQDRDADGDTSQAAAHALSAWQRSMVSKLETAKKAFRRHGGREGTVRVAFSIDREGRLVSESVDRSSGNSALDDLAKRVVRTAEPYPAPPAGARDKDLSFTVPIRFQR